ncbi:hypothetical protein NDU88_002215 [Pleurodeles waltl]|uniref:Uncharacterized protein n=1 Tax=Pleurodeles waltl TaxID=8319 RepID=A0AAV7LDJ5_PLEWA|nr:hypothetical protein NDU88_002215 [Pleurodeles waltl]
MAQIGGVAADVKMARRRERSDPGSWTAPQGESPDAPGWSVGRDRTSLSRILQGRGDRGGRCFSPSACLGELRLLSRGQVEEGRGRCRETLRPARLKTAGVPGPGARRCAPAAQVGQSEGKKRGTHPWGWSPRGLKKILPGGATGPIGHGPGGEVPAHPEKLPDRRLQFGAPEPDSHHCSRRID